MLASGFSFAGMFSLLSAGPFVYIEINHVAPENFGYYFALNIVFLFVMTIFNGPLRPPYWRVKYVPLGLWIQFIMAAWMVHQCATGAGILVAGGWRCGVCGLRVDGVIQCDGGHS